MAKGKFISYLRVSTARQGASGVGLEAQREALSHYLNGGYWTLVQELIEVESGKRNDRPQIAEALRLCRLHKATARSREVVPSRSERAFHFFATESGVEFVACDFPEANRLTVHILAAVAEYEAAMISARTKAASRAAKVRGVELGGLRGDTSRMASSGKRSTPERVWNSPAWTSRRCLPTNFSCRTARHQEGSRYESNSAGSSACNWRKMPSASPSPHRSFLFEQVEIEELSP